MLDRIRRRKYRFIVDDFGRVHNAITSLCRPLRATLRMKGQSMSHVDLVNAQPALLALLEREERQLPTTDQPEDDYQYRYPFTIDGDLARWGKLNYESLVTEGRLYEYLMAKTGMTRADIKRALLADASADGGGIRVCSRMCSATASPKSIGSFDRSIVTTCVLAPSVAAGGIRSGDPPGMTTTAGAEVHRLRQSARRCLLRQAGFRTGEKSFLGCVRGNRSLPEAEGGSGERASASPTVCIRNVPDDATHCHRVSETAVGTRLCNWRISSC